MQNLKMHMMHFVPQTRTMAFTLRLCIAMGKGFNHSITIHIIHIENES
jgi:hypothetical protein